MIPCAEVVDQVSVWVINSGNAVSCAYTVGRIGKDDIDTLIREVFAQRQTVALQ